MGQNVYSTRAFSASGVGGGTGSSNKTKPTIFKGRIERIETHTPKQFVITALINGEEKRLKIGESNVLGLEKSDICLFTCVPNTAVADGASAAWRVTKKPEPAASAELSAYPYPRPAQ